MTPRAAAPAAAPLLRAVRAALAVPPAVRSADVAAYHALLWHRRRMVRDAARRFHQAAASDPAREAAALARELREQVAASPVTYRTCLRAEDRRGPLDFAPYRPPHRVGPPPADLVLAYPDWWFYGEPGAVAQREDPRTVLVHDTWEELRRHLPPC
ncbi:hypothetical protein LP52_17520 [Streptomonospora alba]|uniref:Uncharacterized protein n=1 Tax=Streptomonospora alba TaxID=183763 RepID=A0A0C2JG11_9ACTN|nr:hypothetical protein [Streptomonospora alba]KIH97835.1 hypothetical protein LP52_17520 [Streptomonospora alba]